MPPFNIHTVEPPIMNNSQLRKLVDKYINGTITSTERDKLFEYYDRMQVVQDWKDDLMGDQEEARKRIFMKIQHRIDLPRFRIRLSKLNVAVLVAIVISAVILSLKYFVYHTYKPDTLHYQTLSSAGHILKVNLEDGTKVWLNSGSRLRYPKKFGNKMREVFLEGEAYFDVVHQSKPFVIRSGKIATQVLGTSFNIQAYAADNINKVSVVSGKVGVTVHGKQQNRVVYLTPNQQLAINKQSNAVSKTALADASVAVSWIRNKIKFRNTPLSEAINELERIYKVRISYPVNLKSCMVFADFNRTDNADKVLGMLAKSLAGKVSQKTVNNYFLTGRPCN